jgi:hypothetical protein
MSFGKNPHVSKAQAAEQKAADAADLPAREMAYREAAHQWDRAASREPPGKRRTEYEQNAANNRELADAGDPTAALTDAAAPEGSRGGEADESAAPPRRKAVLN